MEQDNLVAHSERPEIFQKVDSKRRFLPIIIVFSLILGFVGGRSFDSYQSRNYYSNSAAPEDVNLDTFWRVWNVLHENYVDRKDLTTEALITGAITGMVNSIGDPYTVFFPPAESKAFSEQIRGEFGGVGIEIGMRDGVLTVIAPIKDTPAFRAGILAGDKILKIDEKTTDGISVSEAVNLIRGPKGTTVVLSILRNGDDNLRDIPLVRDTIKIPAVEWRMIDGNIALLEVSVFNQNVDKEFHDAAVAISKSSADRIILDLRNNPGGLLDSAVNLASYFLDTGKVVTIEREGNGNETLFKTDRNAMLRDYPVVILLNKGSASASEILAGALRDNRSSTIIGETSYGKGSVQDIFDLPNAASVKVTFAKWFTPNGSTIDKTGIPPNIEVKRTEEDIKADKDPQLDKAIELIKSL